MPAIDFEAGWTAGARWGEHAVLAPGLEGRIGRFQGDFFLTVFFGSR